MLFNAFNKIEALGKREREQRSKSNRGSKVMLWWGGGWVRDGKVLISASITFNVKIIKKIWDVPLCIIPPFFQKCNHYISFWVSINYIINFQMFISLSTCCPGRTWCRYWCKTRTWWCCRRSSVCTCCYDCGPSWSCIRTGSGSQTRTSCRSPSSTTAVQVSSSTWHKVWV